MDRYTNEAGRAAGPDIVDDIHDQHGCEGCSVCEPQSADRLSAALRSLGADLVRHLRDAGAMTPELERRAADLLDVDPPGFDPANDPF